MVGSPDSFIGIPFPHRAGDFLPGGAGDLGIVGFDDGEEEFHFVFGGPGWHVGCDGDGVESTCSGEMKLVSKMGRWCARD